MIKSISLLSLPDNEGTYVKRVVTTLTIFFVK